MGKRRRASMSGKDSHGVPWLSGWGKDRRMSRALERRRRERRALKEVTEDLADDLMDTLPSGFARGGIIPPSLKYDDKQGPYLLSPGYVIPSSIKNHLSREALDKINGRRTP